MRTLFIVGFLLSHLLSAQIPSTLVTERSIVIMEWPLKQSGGYMVRGDWEKSAKVVQENLGTMGVDAIGLLHGDDWSASRESQRIFREFFESRQVKHIISIRQNGDLYELEIEGLGVDSNPWKTNGGSLNQVLFRLGQAIKESGNVRENFLPSESPEIFTDVPFSKWSASLNFPDAIKRLKIGVAMQEDNESDHQLVTLMTKYPFQFDLINYTNDEDAFRQGYQFVLVEMASSGESIKKLLNYKTLEGETHYMSTAAADSSKTKLKAIPVDAFVHKFYFRNTVNHEAFVGVNWDADVTWQQALTNFLLNLRIAFKVN